MSDSQHIEIINLLLEQTKSGRILWNVDIWDYSKTIDGGTSFLFKKPMDGTVGWREFTCSRCATQAFCYYYHSKEQGPEVSALDELYGHIAAQTQGMLEPVLAALRANGINVAEAGMSLKWEETHGPASPGLNHPWWRYVDNGSKRVEGWVTGGPREEWTSFSDGSMAQEKTCGRYVDLEAAKKRVEQVVKQRLEGKQ